jgi:hypothetical protein
MNLPFRIETTSLVYPGGWLANIERLSGRFSDIEVLYFDVDGPYEGVLTLEVFREADLEGSMAVVASLLAGGQA